MERKLKHSQLPEYYTWQDLKDFVRPEAEHEFWVDLKPMPDRSPGKKGCIRTQRWKEAHNLYSEFASALALALKLD